MAPSRARPSCRNCLPAGAYTLVHPPPRELLLRKPRRPQSGCVHPSCGGGSAAYPWYVGSCAPPGGPVRKQEEVGAVRPVLRDGSDGVSPSRMPPTALVAALDAELPDWKVGYLRDSKERWTAVVRDLWSRCLARSFATYPMRTPRRSGSDHSGLHLFRRASPTSSPTSWR
jgi:hypothetical protein